MFALFDVATTNPGHLEKGDLTLEEFQNSTPTATINGNVLELKYCSTCKIARPPRSFHCSFCGYCIQRHDHHCGFVGNCIGKNNTHKFILFISSVVIHCLVVFISTFFALMTHTVTKSQNLWEVQDFFAIIISVISGIFFISVIGLLIFHIYLATNNITTNEHLRNTGSLKMYDDGCKNNWKEICLCS